MNKSRINQILNRTLEKIIPTNKDNQKVYTRLDMINSLIRKNEVKATAIIGGSFAKGTHIKDDFDIDVFVKFDYSYADHKIDDLLEKILLPLNPNRVHGSRDYFEIIQKIGTQNAKDDIKTEELVYEVIPVLDVNDSTQARNITDMSPLHVNWINEELKGKDNVKNDIRLAKLFCKAAGVYGAESYIQGISGHVLDICVTYYGGLIPFFEAVTGWKKKQVVDYFDYYKGNALKEMNRAKLISPLVVIDPIEPARNASAALGNEKFDTFVKVVGNFLENPSADFFKKKKVNVTKLRLKAKKLEKSDDKIKNNLFIIKIKSLDGKEDVVGAKQLKIFNYIKNRLDNTGFIIADSGWTWDKKDKCMIWFIVPDEKLDAEFGRVGPPIDEKTHVEQFKKKHTNYYIKDKRMWAMIKREWLEADKLVEHLLVSDVVKTRVQSIVFKVYKNN